MVLWEGANTINGVAGGQARCSDQACKFLVCASARTSPAAPAAAACAARGGPAAPPRDPQRETRAPAGTPKSRPVQAGKEAAEGLARGSGQVGMVWCSGSTTVRAKPIQVYT